MYKLRRFWIIIAFSFFIFSQCSNSYRILHKYAPQWQGKIVTVKGKVVTWWQTEDYGYYIILLQSLRSNRKIAVYVQMKKLDIGDVIRVKGRFYRDGTLLNLGYDLVVDSTQKFYSVHNPTNRKLKRNYENYPKTFNLQLRRRYKLPPDCTKRPVTIQNSF